MASSSFSSFYNSSLSPFHPSTTLGARFFWRPLCPHVSLFYDCWFFFAVFAVIDIQFSPLLWKSEETHTLEAGLQLCFKLDSLHVTEMRGQRFPWWYTGKRKTGDQKSAFPWPVWLDTWGTQNRTGLLLSLQPPIMACLSIDTQGRNLEVLDSILSLNSSSKSCWLHFLVSSPTYPLVCISHTAPLGQHH